MDYYVLGRISDDLLDELILLIISLNTKGKTRHNLNNLEKV